MKSILVLSFFLTSVVLNAAEPSVYGNSNTFSSPQKTINKNKKMIAILNQKLLVQKEQLDGLKSIVEGLNNTVHELQESLTDPVNNKTSSLAELQKLVNEINNNYVHKSQIKNKSNTIEEKNEKIPKQEKVIISTPSEKYLEGVKLFVKKRYDEAKKRFLKTDALGYKTAASNYYLGEISYYTKKYEDAIFYYKKSAGLDEKASYIDTLLLHTAIALEKRGETKQAKIFYENIIVNYPDRKTAEIAKQKIQKL